MSKLLSAVLAVLLLGGCAGGNPYLNERPAEQAAPAPAAGKALVTFLRPSDVSPAVQASVYDVTDGRTAFIGIVSAKTKSAYEFEPGEHHFMVVSEAADFMGATLRAGRHYYVLVTPRIGLWRARFSLRPVPEEERDSAQFAQWLDACRWVENTDRAEAWARKNHKSVRAKQEKYWTRWLEKPMRPRLRAGDGA